MNTAQNINVVFVPWYLQANIDAVGVDIECLVSGMELGEEVDKLAFSDIQDFQILNAYLNSYFFSDTNHFSDFANLAWTRTERMDSKSRKTKEVELINMLSSGNGSIKDTYTMMYKNNTAYVILNEGSTNFIKFNNKEDKISLYRSLTNFMFKHFNATDVYASPYFKSFLTLKK